MKKLKQNPFWVGIAVAAVALVAIFFWQVFHLFGDEKKLRASNTVLVGKLQTESVPGDKDIEAYNDYRTQVVEAYGKITDHYLSSDKRLERWFDGMADKPSRGEFTVRYSDEIAKLELALTGEKKTEVGVPDESGDEKDKKPNKGGFNWDRPSVDDWNKIGTPGSEDEEKTLKELQKRFWARQRVANVVLTGGAKVTRIQDFRFFRRLHEKLQTADPPLVGKALHYAVPTPSESGNRGFGEFELPNSLGRTMTFGFTLELPYSEVPKVLTEILNPGSEQGATERLLVNVVGSHVTIREQNLPMAEITYTQGQAKEKKDKEDAARKDLKPRDVVLSVVCQIIDFDTTKVKSFK